MHRWLVGLVLLMLVLGGCLGGGKQAPTTSRPGPTFGPPTAPPPSPSNAPAGGFSATNVFPGDYVIGENFSRVLVDGPYKIGKEQVTSIASDVDGEPIEIGFVLPEGGPDTSFPVIVSTSPYFQDLEVGALRTSHRSNPTQIVDFLLDNYVPHGYAVALIPLRGTGGSGGCYGWWSADERADVAQAANWLGTQPWSDGNLAYIGLSLAGAGAWEAAGSGSPFVKTIVPIASETDLYSWFVRNGTSTVAAGPAGTTAFYGFYSVAPVDSEYSNARDVERIQAAAMCEDAQTGLAAGLAAGATGEPDPFGHWASRDLRPAVEENYQGSVFLIHGLYDTLAYPHLVYPWVNTLESQGTTVKHLVGQWRHRMPDDVNDAEFGYNPTPRWDFAEILLHWFDYWLKGDTTRDLGPRVQVADTRDAWRLDHAWPPAAFPMTLFLESDGTLGFNGTSPEATQQLTPDPTRSVTRVSSAPGTPMDRCPECAFFEFPAQPFEWRFAGIPRAQLALTPQGPGGHVTIHLYSEENGTYRLLGGGILDLRFRNGGTTAEPVAAGEKIQVTVVGEPMDVAMAPGAALVLEIGQGGYGEGADELSRALAPAAYYRSGPTNPITLHTGAGQSALVTDIFFRSPEFFFDAPDETE